MKNGSVEMQRDNLRDVPEGDGTVLDIRLPQIKWKMLEKQIG